MDQLVACRERDVDNGLRECVLVVSRHDEFSVYVVDKQRLDFM